MRDRRLREPGPPERPCAPGRETKGWPGQEEPRAGDSCACGYVWEDGARRLGAAARRCGYPHTRSPVSKSSLWFLLIFVQSQVFSLESLCSTHICCAGIRWIRDLGSRAFSLCLSRHKASVTALRWGGCLPSNCSNLAAKGFGVYHYQMVLSSVSTNSFAKFNRFLWKVQDIYIWIEIWATKLTAKQTRPAVKFERTRESWSRATFQVKWTTQRSCFEKKKKTFRKQSKNKSSFVWHPKRKTQVNTHLLQR